jgi:hypothetical protein
MVLLLDEVHRVLKVLKVFRELKGIRDSRVFKVHRESKVFRDSRVFKVHRESKVFRVFKEMLVRKVQLVEHFLVVMLRRYSS